MRLRNACMAMSMLALALFSGCSGNSSSAGGTNTTNSPTQGTVTMMLSDAATDDWDVIGVKDVSIALLPQGGGTPVTVYTAPSSAPMINLVQLDQLNEILGNLSVPPGTYTGATLTLSANPGDVALTAASDPEPGFAGTAGAAVPSNQIEIQGATGSAGSLTVPVSVTLVSPLIVTAGQTIPLDLEFDLSQPATILAHTTAGGTLWAVNFNGIIRHHPTKDITQLVLRHIYGSATAVATDGSSFTMTKVFPAVPPTTPTETSVASAQTLQILADAANGTIVYNVDAPARSTMFDFSTLSGTLAGKFVRVAARFQSNGTLVAVRVWYSTSFQKIWLSPEGHVAHVGAPTGSTSTLTVDNEAGAKVVLTVDGNTQFYFRNPSNGSSDSKVIGTGVTFLSNLVRGFKVHVSVTDPLATTLTADTVDIEIARFDGVMSAAVGNNFTFTHTFKTPADDYTKVLPFIQSTSANGNDPLTGAAITGFKYWYFAFPTVVKSGTSAVTNFSSIVNGAVNFGGSVGTLNVYGATYAVWNDPASPNGWSAPWADVEPSPVPLGTVSVPWNAGTFGMTVGSGTVTVTASTISGSATLVYQVDRSAGGVITVSPQDLTSPTALANVASHLVSGTLVKVFGVPQTISGNIGAYVIFYYTGTVPTS